MSFLHAIYTFSVCITFLKNTNGDILNVMNIKHSQTEYVTTDNGDKTSRINVLTIDVTYTSSDPSKVQATWMKEIDGGSIPIYVGDREFITWSDTFSVSENVTAVSHFIEYLAYKNSSDAVENEVDLNIPDFENTLKQIDLYINVESNTIVKLMNLEKTSAWKSNYNTFSLKDNQEEMIFLDALNQAFTTSVGYSIDNDILSEENGDFSWFYAPKDKLFHTSTQMPPEDAVRLSNGDHGTTLQFDSNILETSTEIKNTLIQNETLSLPCIFVFEMSLANIMLQSSVVVKKQYDYGRKPPQSIKVKAFYNCAEDKLKPSDYNQLYNNNLDLGITNPLSLPTSCVRFLVTYSDSVVPRDIEYAIRGYEGSPHPNPIQSYRMPSGIPHIDFIYNFANGEFEMGKYQMNIGSKYIYFTLSNYSTASVNITNVEMTRTYTKIQCRVTGNPKVSNFKLSIEGMKGECNGRISGCDVIVKPGESLLEWDIPLRYQQLKGRNIVCSAKPKYQADQKSIYTIG